MIDSRITKLAKILVNYSCDLKKGEKILIEANEDVADLILEHERESIDNLEREYNVNIEIQQNQSGIYDRYKLKITGYLM